MQVSGGCILNSLSMLFNLAEHAVDAFLGGDAAALLDGLCVGLNLLDASLPG